MNRWTAWVEASSLVCALSVALAAPAAADTLAPSADVGLELNGYAFAAGDVIEDVATPVPPPVDLGPLPDGANVVAYAVDSEGDQLFVLDHTMELPGGVVATPQMVMAYAGGVYSEEIDLADFGLPRGVRIDALGILPFADGVGFSFDTTVEFLGTVVEDGDVFDIFNNVIVFDASAVGVPAGVGLDAFSEALNGDLLISFDTGAFVGGIAFADEDVLRVTPGLVWSMEVDGSSLDSAWERADLDALHSVPEPSLLLQLGSGVLALTTLGRRRRSRS